MGMEAFGGNMGRRFLALALMVGFAGGASAVPVFGEVRVLRQPDGAPVEVRIWGDEFYQSVESLDGYALVRDPQTLVICYARPSADGADLVSSGIPVGAPRSKLNVHPHLRASSKVVRQRVAEARTRIHGSAKALDKPASPMTGNVQGICLLIDFADQPATVPITEVISFCNTPGYSNYGNNGSVRDYYHDVSNGALTYTNTVPSFAGTIYYRAAHDKSYYDDPTQPAGPRARELIREALTALDQQYFDFSAYDRDDDGYVDALNCFYAGYTWSGWSMGLWPHQGSLSPAWTADGVQVRDYQISDLGSGPTLGTFCHENGHLVCNWPDLYDYDDDSWGVGQFCLMSGGAYATNPVHPCAPLRDLAGWADVTLLTVPQNGLSLAAGASGVFKYAHPDVSTEYFMLENRRAAGRDANLRSSGLALWHVETARGSNNWQDRTAQLHYIVTLVQADGQWHLERNLNGGDAGDLFSTSTQAQFSPATTPNTNWWSGVPSDLAVSGIGAPAAAMTFNFTPPALRIAPHVEFQSQGPPGGPFTPASGSFALENIGAAPLNWTASASQPWLTVSPSSGSLAAGGAAAVQAQFTAAATALGFGAHDATITLTNTTTGEVRTRAVLLRVGTTDNFTESFQGDNDLAYQSVTFTPSAGGSLYTACRQSASAFPTNPAGGAPVLLLDDEFAQMTLSGGRQVLLYGQAYNTLYVGSNGYVTFGGGDTSWDSDLDVHFARPRIAGLFDDLSPQEGGGIVYQQLADRVAVTYDNVPVYGTALYNSFQIEMFFDGRIRLTWLDVDAPDGIVGLSEGAGLPFGFAESEFSGYEVCGASTIVTTLASAAPDPTRSTPIPFAVSFPEPVTGLLASEISVTNGAVSGFAGSDASYTFNVTPVAAGTVTVTIPEGVATGSGGRTNASATLSRVFDNVPPTLTISPPSAAVTASGPVTYTVTYGDASSVTLNDSNITLNGSGATGTVSVSPNGTTRTVTVSGITGNGTLSIAIAPGTATDAAGNTAPAAGPSEPFTVDNTAIAVNIGPPSATLTRNGPVSYFVTYENVETVSLAPSKVTLNRTGTANGSVSVTQLKAETNTTRIVAVTNITGTGTLNISLLPDTARDALDNPAPAAGPGATFVVDNEPPVLSLLGPVPDWVEQGGIYSDPGALATDNVDGDVTADIAMDASGLDTAVPGIYYVTYTVSDSLGNTATQGRTVWVLGEGESLPLAAAPLATALILAGVLIRRRK